MRRNLISKILGVLFMLAAVYLAIQGVTVSTDAGALIVNIIGALMLFLVGAWVTGLLPYVLKQFASGIAANYRVILASLLVAVSLLCGVGMLFLGIGDSLAWGQQTRDYVSAEAYFSGTEVYSRDEDGTTYRLAYSYTVNGQKYTVLSDFGTQIIPELGTPREIRYDPRDPGKAVISGAGQHSGLVFGGILFVGVSLVMIVGALYKFGFIKNRRINVVELVMGTVFGLVGMGVVYIVTGTFSLVGAFRYLGLFGFIPAMFVAVAIYLVVRGLFFNKGNKCR